MRIYINEELLQIAIIEKGKRLLELMIQRGVEINKDLYTKEAGVTEEEYFQILNEINHEEKVNNWPPELVEKARGILEAATRVADKIDFKVVTVQEVLDILNFTEEEVLQMSIKDEIKNSEDGKRQEERVSES